MSHAYDHVPYYHELFNTIGLKPEDIRGEEEFRKIPYLTREIIREQLPRLVARNFPPARRQAATTGGSSGTPLAFYYERHRTGAIQWAFIVAQWKRVGFRVGDRCAMLGGGGSDLFAKGKLWRYDPVSKILIFSPFAMTDEALRAYFRKIQSFKPRFIRAYPSAVSVLATFMKANGLGPIPSVKAVLCGSEPLYSWQRTLIEDVFQCRTYSWYGHTEMAVLAGECEISRDYHVFPEYGYVEIIRENGADPVSPTNTGEIVATNLHNYVCPLIRYKTGDIAEYSDEPCDCGRPYPLLKRIEGRIQEYIVTKDKRRINLTSLIFAQHFEAFGRVKGMQLVQEIEGEVTVRIVPTPLFSRDDEQELSAKIREAAVFGLEIKFEYPSEIPRTRMGKHLFLIQKLNLNA